MDLESKTTVAESEEEIESFLALANCIADLMEKGKFPPKDRNGLYILP